MIPASEVLRLVRFKNKDNDEVEYSDYDIKTCLNEALRYISQSQALQNSDFLTKSEVFDETALNADIQKKNEEIQSNPDYLEEDLFLHIDYDYIYNEINKLNFNNIDIRDIMTLNDYYETDTHWKQENLEKVIKNRNFYCILILFYTPTNFPRQNFALLNY